MTAEQGIGGWRDEIGVIGALRCDKSNHQELSRDGPKATNSSNNSFGDGGINNRKGKKSCT